MITPLRAPTHSFDVIESGACLQPTQLIGGHGMRGFDKEHFSILLCHAQLDIFSGPRKKISEADRLNLVSRANATIVALVGKPKGKNTLFL